MNNKYEQAPGVECRISSWKDLLQLYYGELKNFDNFNFSLSTDPNTRWIFRADSGEDFLKTHLEKAFHNYNVPDDMKQKYELYIIREFQRKASLYIEHEPHKDDILEWLSLMRHYGAATRLLDWTYSFFIAAYFALAENPKGGVIWALNMSRIGEPTPVLDRLKVEGHLEEFSELYTQFSELKDVLGIRESGDKLYDLAITCYFMKKPLSFVYPVNPFRCNKRLTVQRGLFLLTGDVRKPFLENLVNTFKDEGGLNHHLYKIILTFDKDDIKEKNRRNEFLRQLHNMNLTNATLFPSLDGFAKSLQEYLAYPEVFPPS